MGILGKEKQTKDDHLIGVGHVDTNYTNQTKKDLNEDNQNYNHAIRADVARRRALRLRNNAAASLLCQRDGHAG